MTEEGRRNYQLLVLTAWADGKLHELETRELERIVEATPLLRELQKPEADELAREARELLARVGLAEALTEIGSNLVHRDSRELAFAACARVLEADRHIAKQEFEVLARLKAMFGFDAQDISLLLRQ